MAVKPTILKKTIVARSRLFRVEQLELRFSNGVERTYERLAGGRRGAVMIVPVTENHEVLLIQEYAGGLDNYQLTLPKGLVEPDEDVLEAANRELMEEAGVGARRLEVLTELSLAPNYMGHMMTVVLARDLYERKLPGDEPEPLLVERHSLDAIPQLLQRPDFTEARAIAALYMTRDKLAAENA